MRTEIWWNRLMKPTYARQLLHLAKSTKAHFHSLNLIIYICILVMCLIIKFTLVWRPLII